MTPLFGRAPSQESGGARLWISLLTLTSARVTLAAAAGLLIWAHVPPLVLDWQPTLVVSASMRPRITPGDVVLYQPLEGRAPLRGQVVLVRDPAHPSRLLSHRVRKVLPDGRVITAGDANRRPDSTPVPSSQLLGFGRLRIPSVGLPVMWWRDREYGTIAATALLVLGTARLAALRLPGTGALVPQGHAHPAQ
ncbi:hypothetical protein ABZ208_07945 [Streptomyces sp. NPDC006208]|uniref:hypothetical protein n=1 Tax=Streptomyces sp. NPDC006208 TaxID=3156734 RepID=UPI0033A00C8E